MKMYFFLASALFLVPVAPVQAQKSNQLLELMQQMTRLETEVRQLRGEVERLSHENKRLKNQQNDLYVDLDQRLRALSSGQSGNQPQLTVEPVTSVTNTTPASSLNPPSATGVMSGGLSSTSVPADQPASTLPPVPAASVIQPPADPAKEQAAYKAAFNLLKVGKYAEAIVSYSDFLRKYPGGQYAANAQYWLGEANYVTRQFPVALIEFNKVITGYPDSRKLPDAMLKIGYIHYELKQSDDARRVLVELTQKYPGTTPARLAENRLQRMKLEGR